MNDGLALSLNNLKAGSAGYYNGCGSTFCLPTSGKWISEHYVGNRYNAYTGQGWCNHQYEKITDQAQSAYEAATSQDRGNPNSALAARYNDDTWGYTGTGTTHYTNLRKPDGTTAADTNPLLYGWLLDIDNNRWWIGTALVDGASTAWTWFGPGTSDVDPTDATTGFDVSAFIGLSKSQGDWKRFSWFHTPNSAGGDAYSISNWGQDSTFGGNMTAGGNTDSNGYGDFQLPVPSGFNALCSANLPIDENLDPANTEERMPCNVVEYTGTGGNVNVTGVGFKPDLVVIKRVDSTEAPAWFDSSRGVLNEVASNGSNDENTTANSLTAFGTDGFTVGSDKSASTGKFDAMCWKCDGGTTSSNSNGTITSTVQVNQAAGFSIVQWTGTGTNTQTIGHGLGVKPAFIIIKNRSDDSTDWLCWHQYMNSRVAPVDNYAIKMNTTTGYESVSNSYDVSGITSTTIGINSSNAINGSTDDMVAWVWAEKDQYSMFGSYQGNGNACATTVSSPGVPMNFKPRILWIKRTDSAEPWLVYYREIEGYLSSAAKGESGNPKSGYWSLESNGAETYYENMYIHGNGFSCGDNNSAEVNASGGSYVFCAWGETPMRYGTAFQYK